jgi:hypothetical protein
LVLVKPNKKDIRGLTLLLRYCKEGHISLS